MQHFLVFGLHPRLSLAEATAVLELSSLRLIGSLAVLETEAWDGAWLQDRLAGITKLGNILFSCPLEDLSAERIVEALPHREGTSKLTFALTIQGQKPEKIKRLPIQIKQALKSSGRSIRWFSDKDGQVSPAAVAKLDLTNSGYDLVIAIEKNLAHVGLTTHVQDADAWSLRDYGRPARDAKNGMLPPKLARMMVNLGLGNLPPEKRSRPRILDPFCGSGTIPMEAVLLAQQATVIASDIDARQTADTDRNLDWMVEKQLISPDRRQAIQCFTHDVRLIDGVIRQPVDLIVTEGFLGTPLQGHETTIQLEREVRSLKELWQRSLLSLARIQSAGGVMVAIWPILKTSHGQAEVSLEDNLKEAGYELINHESLIYARPDQRVQRRIVVLRKV